ncbi:MAG: efflux RND transporter periplasmic adaptor subunit [Candidatus Kapaibacteriota bacterium]
MKKSKKLLTLFAIALLILLSVGLLFNNRSKNLAKAKKNVVLSTFPVYVSKAKVEDINLSLEYNGTVLPNAEVNIASETNGKVVAVNANLGSYIAKGAILIKLDDQIRQANFLTAKASYEKMKKDLERYEKLYAEKSISENQIEQMRFQFTNAEAQYNIAKKQLEETKIVAPFSGFITSKMVEVGQVVSTGTPLMSLIDISNVKIRIQVPERDILKLKIGDVVEIKSDLLPQEKFIGKIQNIGYKSDEAKTYPVEIIVKNPKNLLKAGMFVRATIPSAIKGRTLLIPREALVGSSLDPKVYIVENNVVKLKPIVLGNEYGKKLEVLRGLNEGDLVVVEGIVNLKDGTSVQIVGQN